jgi:Asp-tRNA(Asn)/Glu-tRNA(Gln) amidotransferase A subunit family amidase
MTAADVAAAIKKKQVSPVEVVDAVLARIEKTKRLNAYCLVDADGARDAAKAAEHALMEKGAKLGPLHGVPFSVKDLVITKGLATTFGTPIYRDNVTTEDAPSVAGLRRAGAIVIGKTNTPIFGYFAAEIGGVKVGRDAGSAFTFPFNMTCQPAATVPCGFTNAGLPIGLQIVGRRFADTTVLRAAAAFEAAQPWAQHRPPEIE